MAHTFVLNYVHLVFSTKDFVPYIDDKIESLLFAYLAGICKRKECESITVGGYRNHVHILFNLSKKVALMDLVEDLKKYSSMWMKQQGEEYAGFRWKVGYGAFSVSPSMNNRTRKYILNQREHHQKRSFQDEMEDLDRGLQSWSEE